MTPMLATASSASASNHHHHHHHAASQSRSSVGWCCPSAGRFAHTILLVTFVHFYIITMHMLFFVDSPPSTSRILPSDAPLETAPCPHHHQVQIVFFSGCSPFHNLQSYAFFHQALQVQQPGNITRIASCRYMNNASNDEQQLRQQQIVRTLSTRFDVHYFTPIQSNHQPSKPFALKHWMEHALGYPNHVNADTDNTVIALLESDMILLKPFINNFPTASAGSSLCVRHGSPVLAAQPQHQLQHVPGPSSEWMALRNSVHSDFRNSTTWNLDDPLYRQGAELPYMFTARDLYALVRLWCQWITQVRKQSTNPPLVESFAYSMAASQLQLRHQWGSGLVMSSSSSSFPNGITADPNQKAMTLDNMADACERSDAKDENRPVQISSALMLQHGQYDSFTKFYLAYKYNINSRDLRVSCHEPRQKQEQRHKQQQEQHQADATPKSKADSRSNTMRSLRFIDATCQLMRTLDQAVMIYQQHNHCDSLSNNANQVQPYI